MKGLLNKKYVDMTMGDMLKINGVITIGSFVIGGISYAVAKMYEKKQYENMKARTIKCED